MRYQLRHYPLGSYPAATDKLMSVTRARAIMTFVNRRLASVRGFGSRCDPGLGPAIPVGPSTYSTVADGLRGFWPVNHLSF